MAAPLPDRSLRELYTGESARIRERFEASRDGIAAVQERSALVDRVVAELAAEQGVANAAGLDLAAVGGYGRRMLFPHSDADLLFLAADERTIERHREAIAAIGRALWDLGVRASTGTRTLAECARLDPANPEFLISLLDARSLAGDGELFARLRQRLLPRLVAREQAGLVHHLAALTRQRHARYADTIFHLEPNVKEAPGGLRDFQSAAWLALVAEVKEQRRWVTAEGMWPAAVASGAAALAFLGAVRAFLHYHYGRNDNQLNYDLQAEAAARGIGHPTGAATEPAAWMRNYFRHARTIERLAARQLDAALTAQSSLYGLFQDWRSRLSNASFDVVRERIYVRQPAALAHLDELLGLFEFSARHGLELSEEAARQVEEAFPRVGPAGFPWPGLWEGLRRILAQPRAALALRAMHRSGVLGHLFPEFAAIDSLVLRDFFHRYTVDEHTFEAIEALERLRAAREDWAARLAELLATLDQPELVRLALLFHDVGKGLGEDHVEASLRALEDIERRLALTPAEQETVRFLVAQHLLMSQTIQRRDIFDPETIKTFAEAVGTNDRLKMLCLLTYADIRAVNPEAWTPWKAEMLWQLYAAAANYLHRTADAARFHAREDRAIQAEVLRFVDSRDERSPGLRRLAKTAPALAPAAQPEALDRFLEGFPARYFRMRAPEEIAAHFAMASDPAAAGEPAASVRLAPRRHAFELTVVTRDRPFLFASLTGTLAAWGMNIVKADAFANAAGLVLDTFYFTDPFRTLELNPGERARLEESLLSVLSGQTDLASLLQSRRRSAPPRPKLHIATKVRFDDTAPATSTLVELIAQDRPGLLYDASRIIAEAGCNIEIALIDTEGPRAVDVFYLTAEGRPLDPARQQALAHALIERL
jgi:[protein-PII] uridylyltransferase